jgi:LysM domain
MERVMPSVTPKPKANHKVKDRETIEQIAKKYGFNNIKDIWEYEKNATLVKLRKDAKAIQAGDVIVIPAYNDEERKDIQDRQDKYLIAASMEKHAAAAFSDQAAADRKLADVIDQVAAEHAAAGAAYIKEYQASVKQAETWSQGVDFAGMVFGIVNALRKLTLKSIEASETLAQKGKDAFEKVYAELVKDSKGFTNAPLVSEASKQAGKALVDQKAGPMADFLIVSGVALESYGKWSSPSFYGQAVSLLAEGKGWSEAATFDLKNDCKACVAKMAAEISQVQKLAKQKSAAARNRAAWADNASKAAEKSSKEMFAEANRR